jgi:hypothetical protein
LLYEYAFNNNSSKHGLTIYILLLFFCQFTIHLTVKEVTSKCDISTIYITTEILFLLFFFFLILIVGGRVQLGPLGTAATDWHIVPAPGDYDDGEFGGMMIGRGN